LKCTGCHQISTHETSKKQSLTNLNSTTCNGLTLLTRLPDPRLWKRIEPHKCEVDVEFKGNTL